MLGKQYSLAGSLSISPKAGVAGAKRTRTNGTANRLGQGTEIQDFSSIHRCQGPMSVTKLENPFQAFRPLSLSLFLQSVQIERGTRWWWGLASRPRTTERGSSGGRTRGTRAQCQCLRLILGNRQPGYHGDRQGSSTRCRNHKG